MKPLVLVNVVIDIQEYYLMRMRLLQNTCSRVTQENRSWGFGLSFLYLRNVKGYAWNNKRVYRIYCELELNLRTKKRLKRDKPEALGVPQSINQTWS